MMTTTTEKKNGKQPTKSTPEPELAAPRAPARHEELKLTAIHVGPQPRKTFDKAALDELAANIKLLGVLEPVLVRPLDSLPAGEYELVFGERRLRASTLAEAETIPATIRVMSDLEVLEAQIAENDKRAGLHPLEEAETYRALHEKHGFSVEEIAAKVNKSVPAVYARLKLCALCPEGKEAFYAGRLTAGTAIFVARIPSEDLQREALAKIEEEAGWMNEDREDEPDSVPEPLGVRDAARIMQKHFMLRLDGAPFSITDANLLPLAGACSTCPKRTGSQPELFSDVKSADTCTDPTCFNDKKAAAVAQTLKEAKKAGQRVLTKEETKAVFPHGRHVASSAPYVDLAEKNYSGGGSGKTFKSILGKNAPPPILAVDGNGEIRELVPRSAATKALKAAAKEKPPSKSLSDHEKAEREQFSAGDKGNRRAIAELASKAEKTEPPTLWRAIAVELVDLCYDADFRELVKRRGIKNAVPSTMKAAASKMAAGQARGFALELLAGNATQYSGHGAGTFLAAIFAMFKIDLKKHTAAAQAEETKARVAPEKPTGKAAPKKATKSAKKKPGRG